MVALSLLHPCLLQATPHAPAAASHHGQKPVRLCKLRLVADPDLEAERLLCERAQAGDRNALGELLIKHGPRLYRSVLLPRLGSASAAEEALSMTYAKVVERIDRFEWQEVGVYPWLRMVAMRTALDQLRKRKREVLFDAADLERELESSEPVGGSASDLERLDLERAREQVQRVLGRINPRYATAIRLRILEERSREEAAATLEISVATFDVVLHRALAALKKALAVDGAPGDSP